MTLFRMPRFIRRFVRRRTTRIPEDQALYFKKKLSLAYAFCSWNLFGFLFYMVYTGCLKKSDDSDLSQGLHFVKLLRMENVHLYQVRNLTSVKSYDLNKEYTKLSDINTEATTEDAQEELMPSKEEN